MFFQKIFFCNSRFLYHLRNALHKSWPANNEAPASQKNGATTFCRIANVQSDFSPKTEGLPKVFICGRLNKPDYFLIIYPCFLLCDNFTILPYKDKYCIPGANYTMCNLPQYLHFLGLKYHGKLPRYISLPP